MDEPDDEGVAARELREAMGAFVTGVTIVTSGRDNPHGMTLNAITSVSLEPPLILICIQNGARMQATIVEEERFSVSVLGDCHADLATYFAMPDRPYGEDGFEGVDTWAGPTFRHPILEGAASWMECTVEGSHRSGDHTVLTAKVVECGTSPRTPLLFSRGALVQPSDPDLHTA